MDPVSVVGLALQLACIVKSSNAFLSTIREAPHELVTLMDTMEQMEANLNQVHDMMQQQHLSSRLPDLPILVPKALETCRVRIKALDAFVQKIKQGLESGKVIKRTWTSLNIGSKKARLSELEKHLKDAMLGLHFAVSNNVLQLQ